uniref:SH3 and multiple ankyrin repeat domains 2 n=1 Tax=Tetraodon nigroviridis TaxID=99883 RepID=H3CEA4_TETNG
AHINWLVVRVLIPDLQQTKCLRFDPAATVWSAKQRVLCSLSRSLKGALNYGLFQPPGPGGQGRFLEEERLLREYPQPISRGVPALEFRYKSRVYKQPPLEEKQICKLHTKANLRRFLDLVQQRQVEKVSQLLERGLDPNYQDSETGAIPLRLPPRSGVSVSDSRKLNSQQLVVELKTVFVFTCVRGACVVEHFVGDLCSRLKPLSTLPEDQILRQALFLTRVLELGPLAPPAWHLLLLTPASGRSFWRERSSPPFRGGALRSFRTLPSACLSPFLLLLQETCARVLLARGADKEVKNFNGQSPSQVAIIAGNFELAELIKKHKDSDIVPFREAPAYSKRRRGPSAGNGSEPSSSSLAAPRVLLRSNSDNNLTVGQYQQHGWTGGAQQQQHAQARLQRPPQQGPPQPGSSALHRSLSPQLLQQMPSGSPNGNVVVRTMGRGARSRSPSLSRLGEEVRRAQRQPRPSTSAAAQRSPTCGSGTGTGPWVLRCRAAQEETVSVLPHRNNHTIKSSTKGASCKLSFGIKHHNSATEVGGGGVVPGVVPGVCGDGFLLCLADSRADRADRRKLFRHYTVGSYDSFDASRSGGGGGGGGDCVVDEKTVVLQKKENEGFGFVLRGAKADTPIEEFTPTPAFPALQYLESVDEGGVAWQAGLRTGDFLIEVNQENVVKVGHRQVVNMIRQGGNRLLIKVVTVSRNLDPDDTARKKAPPPPKRAPTTALSMRSKSMTSELEELDQFPWQPSPCVDVQKKRIVFQVTLNKVEEMTHAQKASPIDMKIATIKPRPSSRCLVTAADMNSMYHDRQGVAVVPPTVPGAYLGIPEKGTMRKQKSIGTAEDEKQGFLTPPLLKFARSLSMPDTSEDIPPPPAISPPSPPAYNSPAAPGPKGYGATRPSFTQNSANAVTTISQTGNVGTLRGSEQFESTRTRGRTPVPENPYSEVGNKTLYIPAKPARRKGMLVKQSNVEDSPEKTCHMPASPSGPVSMPTTPVERTCSSIPIPTIIVKEPSTSSSGKSSQGSSMEIEPTTPEHPPLAPTVGGSGGLRPDDPLSLSNPFAAAIAGAVRDREKRLEAKKNSVAFQSIDMGDDDFCSPTPTPRLRQSKSIDEGMFSSDERLRRILAPPPAAQLGPPVGGGSGNMTDFNTPEPTVHPVTGKPLDPNSPLALALAARDRAMKEQQNHPQNQPQNPPQVPQAPKHEAQSLPVQPSHKPDLNQPLFIDTKRQMTEQKYETDGAREERQHRALEERKSAPADVTDASKPKSAGLLMVHTSTDPNKTSNQDAEGQDSNRPAELKDPNQPDPLKASMLAANPLPPSARRRSIPLGDSMDEPVKLPFRIPPPPLASVDIDEEFEFSEPLPPPLEFANSIDIPDDQASAIAEMLKQQRRNGGPALPPYHPHAPPPVADHHKRVPNSKPPAYAPPPDHESAVGDSGIEEVDSRSSGDPQHMETTSTVSSISTLSSEGGFCDSTLESLYTSADGHAFLVERPPVPPKPKGKSIINRTSLYHDALIEEAPESYGTPPQAPPPPPSSSEPPRTPTQRSSKLWGDPPSTPDSKNTVIGEFSPQLHVCVLSQFSPALPWQPAPSEKPVWRTGAPRPSGVEVGSGCAALLRPFSHSRRCHGAGLTVVGAADGSSEDGLDSHTLARFVFPYFSSWIKRVGFCLRMKGLPGNQLIRAALRPVVMPVSAGGGGRRYVTSTAPIRNRARPPAVSGSELSVCSVLTSDLRPPPGSSTPPGSLPSQTHPCSPPDSASSLTPCSSLPPSVSPTLTDVFGLATPPMGSGGGYSLSSSCGGSGSSRSPSPLTLMQAASASGKAFASKPVELWSKHDVADWLESLNLAEHRDAFLDNEIEGAHLPSLQKEDLIDLGVTRVGHRMNIERALKLLQDR